MNIKKKETIKHCIATSFLLIAICIVIIIIIKYQVNGEKNMPFQLSKITIISTAEGIQNNSNLDVKWNMDINQSNDVYFFIDKNNKTTETSKIKSVTIENIQITDPLKGTIKTYMPNSAEGRRFVYDDNFLVKDKLEYKGAKASNEKNLEIGNQGGNFSIRFANTNVATYSSNDDTEIVHNGSLIKKAGLKNEEIKFKVNFDLIIQIDQIKYKANIDLELPYDDILEKGTTQIEKTNMQDIVFKRM